MSTRGSYAKGRAKREEILTKALDVIEREGFRGTSVRELADAVGLSQTGLLHYFDSKDELFAEVLRKRDENGLAVADPGGGVDTLVEESRRNVAVPGLVQLYAQLSVESAEDAHPAHDYFTQRYERLRASTMDVIEKGRAAGTISPDVDPELASTALMALFDGLQIQWLYNPELDIEAHLEYLWQAVVGEGRVPS